MSQRYILDLCSGTGAWSQPYVDAGYEVRRVTWPEDVRLIYYPGEIHGILAAPPCTMFSIARGANRPTRKQWLHALSVVDACLRLVAICDPQWWALENPVGHLSKWLGAPTMKFHPYHYGDPWTKNTAIWGRFTVPTENRVPPYRGSIAKRVTSSSPERYRTPSGFARAFFEANP